MAALYSREIGFDRGAIMRAAWAAYRDAAYECTRRALAKGFIPLRFRNCLRAAWAEAKQQRRDAEPVTAARLRENAIGLRQRALSIENTACDWIAAHRFRADAARSDALAVQLDRIEALAA